MFTQLMIFQKNAEREQWQLTVRVIIEKQLHSGGHIREYVRGEEEDDEEGAEVAAAGHGDSVGEG